MKEPLDLERAKKQWRGIKPGVSKGTTSLGKQDLDSEDQFLDMILAPSSGSPGSGNRQETEALAGDRSSRKYLGHNVFDPSLSTDLYLPRNVPTNVLRYQHYTDDSQRGSGGYLPL